MSDLMRDPVPDTMSDPLADPTRLTKPHIIAIANQKGGVGKTTTCINLAAALVERGARVLLVDIDPQGNASTGLGIGANQRKLTSYDVILESAAMEDVVLSSDIEGLLICPGSADLASTDIELVANEKRSFLLHDALRNHSIDRLRVDFILIDCPPSLSLLTVNALVASDAVLIPLQAEFFALEGLSQLMLTIRQVRQSANPGLRVEGVLLTMHDGRNRLSLQVEADARETLGDLVFKTIIPRNVRLSEAPSFAKPILTYDSNSRGSEAYRALAEEILARHPLARTKEAT